MSGRYGPYVTDGTTNATLPRDKQPETLTAAEAVALIDERAAKGPAKGKKKAPPRRLRRRRRLPPRRNRPKRKRLPPKGPGAQESRSGMTAWQDG
jgi:DNA topoisomerase-1